VAILKVIAGGARNTGRRYVIDRDQIYIGRDPGNDIVVQDVGVTGYHARIIKTELGYLLIEERTSTGIWVDDQKVSSLFLKQGTRFRLGGTAFMFDTELSDTLMVTPAAADVPVPLAPGPPPFEAPPSPASLVATVPGVVRPVETPAAAPAPLPAAPEPPPASGAEGPAWASGDDLAEQLALPDRALTGGESALEGQTCPGCEAPLLGLERFCAICGARTRYGGRGRVMLLKILALVLVLGAGSAGLYTLTDGDLSRGGLRRAIALVLGDRVPSWLKL